MTRRLATLLLLAGALLLGSPPGWPPALAALDPPTDAQREPSAQVPTRVEVLVIAHGGKYVGDDIGGAMVTLRDARTQELLASGRTRGGSGPADLVTVDLTRLQERPDEDAARFEATLLLDEPRLVEITAYGPLAAAGSAIRSSTMAWLLPAHMVAGPNRVIVSLRGLAVQIVAPPTHFLPAARPPLPIPLRANLTMMCGCPVGPNYPWRPEEYQVVATIRDPAGAHHVVPLAFDANAPDRAPSQFVGAWTATAPGVHEVTVTAQQSVHDNTGVDRATFILP